MTLASAPLIVAALLAGQLGAALGASHPDSAGCAGVEQGVLCVPLPAWASGACRSYGSWIADNPHAVGIAVGAAVSLVLVAAAVYFGLIRTGLIYEVTRMFLPAKVTVIHNPLVRQPMEIFSETVDLGAITEVDPDIAAVAGALGYGMGIKGGIARKILKILHGTPEPPTADFDIDAVLLVERGMTPEEQTEFRKTVTGMQLGHLALEPKDVEVISKEELQSYWITRDICLNEVLLLRLAPGAPLTLFYSDGALHDAANNVIRSIPHALKSDFTECWSLDGDKPILSPKHVARTILRYFKGHGKSYEFDEATWAFYRRTKLAPITLFQILRTVHADDEKYKAVVTHLIDVGLLSSKAVRACGGFNQLWGAVLAEVNDKMAQFGGRLSLDDLDAEAVERWIVNKRAKMRSLPYRQRERASRTGYIPADEDTLSLGLISFPPEFLDYIEREGGLWDPEHPEGRPSDAPPASPGRAALRPAEAPLPRLPLPSQLQSPSRSARDAVSMGAHNGSASNLAGSSPQGDGLASRWLGALGGAWARVTGSAGSEAQSGLREPLLPGVASEGALSFKTPSRQASQTAAAGQQGGVRFVPAHALMDNAPAVSANEGRLGQAWLVEPQVSSRDISLAEEDEEVVESEAAKRNKNQASRYSSFETILYIARIAAAAWPLLLCSSALIMLAVGLHLYQLRIQSKILNAATAGDAATFTALIIFLPKVCLTYVLVNWLSGVVLQLYLKQAMQGLYVGLFSHVIFQEPSFYEGISTSELATRTGVDMMNLRVLVGYLVQKLVKGTTQVLAGITLLVVFAGPMLTKGFGAIIGSAVAVSVVELVGVSLIIRRRHRVARSMLGRLYGFAYDVFSSIQGVVAMALQRNFTAAYAKLAEAYFHAAMVLAVWMGTHQCFLEAVFYAGVTVGLLYIGGNALLGAATSVGTVYAMLRYISVVQQGYMALSEGVARFYASYGSLEHVIELSERGQLTTNGKTPVLEALEREESMAVVVPTPRSARRAPVGPEQLEEGAGELPPPAHRLAAQRWAGGVRCRGVHYGYKGKPSSVLFSVDLELLPGQLVLAAGDTGSGRSTLAHLLHLDLTASAGSVQFQLDSGAWLPYHPTSTDRYDLQQRMGYASPGSCIEGIFFATIQENMVAACTLGRAPSVADCQEAAAFVGFDADVAQLPDGYQTLVGEASRVDLAINARMRLGIARLLLLHRPKLVIIDDADRFFDAVPHFAEAVVKLQQGGAAVFLTAPTSRLPDVTGALPGDLQVLFLERGRLRSSA